MRILPIAALIAFAACLSNCASPRTAAVVRGEVVDALCISHDRAMTGIPSLALATDLGLIGSTIGRGCTANGIGAAGGVLIGGVMGYCLEKSDAHRRVNIAMIKLPDGRYFRVENNFKNAPPLRVGQRVWVAMDCYGLPLHLVTASQTPEVQS